MLVFYFTYDPNDDSFRCYSKTGDEIEMPIPEHKLRKAYKEGFMAFVVTRVNDKIRCKMISRQYVDAPWHTKDKNAWNEYSISKR